MGHATDHRRVAEGGVTNDTPVIRSRFRRPGPPGTGARRIAVLSDARHRRRYPLPQGQTPALTAGEVTELRDALAPDVTDLDPEVPVVVARLKAA